MTHARWTLLAGLLAACGIVVAVGAQKVDIKTHRDPKADFTAVKTYAWLPPAPLVKNVAPDALSNPTLSQEALGPPIVAAVTRELTSRGLTEASAETADVQVVYFAALTVGFNNTYLGEYYGYVTGWASPIAPGYTPSTSMTVYERGTVIVDVVHRASKRAMWRGTAATRIHQELTLAKRTERINEAAKRMFRDFPIRPRK
jgi:Domain of unknown function (DUF4136)